MKPGKVNIHEAQTKLSQLIDAAEAGETVVLARAGKPVVRLVRSRNKGVTLGPMKGKIAPSVIDAIARPLTRKQIDALFGGRLEP